MAMDDKRMTAMLVVEVLGWQLAQGRFIRQDRTWIPSWRFAPFKNLEDAFQLVEKSGASFWLGTAAQGGFEAEIQIGESVGVARGTPKARVLMTALIAARGLGKPDE